MGYIWWFNWRFGSYWRDCIHPSTGSSSLFCLIAGQLAGSVLLDHVGAFKLSVRKFSFTKTAGILITFGGVLIVRYGN